MRQKNLLLTTYYLLVGLLITSHFTVLGQQPTTVNSLVQSFDQYRRQALTEKLFVHTDQSFYLTGETMWFKAYYVDGTFHRPLDLSKVAYVELLDKDQKSVLQTKIALTTGGGSGNLFLPASLNAGTYLMRAYTNWMKNFSADFFFEKTITIVNPFKPLNLPLLKETPDYDVQFFPEGGQLVRGLPGRVAFKVVDASGRGVAVRGVILNAQNDTLTTFKTHKFGMGTFALTPSESTYRVMLSDEKGRLFTRPLPAIQAQGYTMRVDDAAADQLKITVATNAAPSSTVYLFAHTRQDIKIAEQKSIGNDQTTTFLVDKKLLGEGISHLTIFNDKQQPVSERLYFKRPARQLAIAMKPNQSQYAPRTTVKLDITADVPVRNAGPSSVNPAALSMAVYRVDSLGTVDSGNILSYLWMTSDLRGGIESPEYYLQSNPEVEQATDNLMLTHGWRRFRWEEVLNPSTIGTPQTKKPERRNAFIAEHNGLIVEGTVTDPTTGAPVPEIMTLLSAPGKPVRLYASRSDKAGKIRFEMPDFYGARSIIVQTYPEDSLSRLTINSPFSESLSATRLPDCKGCGSPIAEFSLEESQANQLLDRSVAMQVEGSFSGSIASKYRYPVVDSTAFYGKPSESYMLDTYTRFPRMEEVLREYVPGVMPRKRQGHFRLFVPNAPYSTLFDTPSLVLLDGVPIFDMDKIIEFSPLKVKQLDVITNQHFIGPALFTGVISFMTYKGDLAGFPLDYRLLKMEYDGLQVQREFYVPRHATATSRLPDTRTLLYWNADLKADAQGKVLVEFPTSDQLGTFMIDVNGLTPDGVPGSQRMLFEVKSTVK